MKTRKQIVTPAPMSRVIRGGFPDRQFDVDFWQQLGDAAIFEAAWEMVEFAEAIKGGPAPLRPDFRNFLRLLNERIDATPDNAKRVYQALVEFGAPMADLTVHDLTQQRIVFQFGMAPARVDVMTSNDAVPFPEAWEQRVQSDLDGIPIWIISLEHLKQN